MFRTKSPKVPCCRRERKDARRKDAKHEEPRACRSKEARPVADHVSECFNGGLQSRVRDGPGVRLKTRETREGARAQGHENGRACYDTHVADEAKTPAMMYIYSLGVYTRTY